MKQVPYRQETECGDEEVVTEIESGDKGTLDKQVPLMKKCERYKVIRRNSGEKKKMEIMQ